MAREHTSDRLKELWENFKPKEIQIFGAFMYGYQNRLPYLKDELGPDGKTMVLDKVQPLPKYYRHPLTRTERPWSIYDRWRMAVATFDVEMKRHPGQKLNFAIADLDADGTVKSGNVMLEEKLLSESKKAWDVIFGAGGLSWGDEKTLAKWVEEYEPVMKAYGFEKLPKTKDGRYEIAPLVLSEGGMSDIMNLDDAETESMIPAPVPEEESVVQVSESATDAPRRPGRPRKAAVA